MSLNHPVFSDYSHLSDINHVSFAVGLREDEENNQKNIYRILPMTKIVPVVKQPRNIPIKKIVQRTHVEDEPVVCQRPDCVARRQKLSELHLENDGIRAQHKIIENKMNAAKHRKLLAEKTISATEERNDLLRNQIEDIQTKMEGLEAEITIVESSNQKLRNKLLSLEQEIEVLKSQADTDTEKYRTLQAMAVEEIIFAPKSQAIKNSINSRYSTDHLADEVRTLRMAPDEDDDSDADD